MGRGRGGLALWCLVVLCAPSLLTSCTPHPRAVLEGVPVLDEIVALTRGPRRDTAEREITVTQDATFVAIVEESDADVQLRLERRHDPGNALDSIEVESHFNGEGIEIAVLDAKAGDRLRLTLEGPHDFEQPRSAPVKLLRYDAALRAQPPVSARLSALRSWSDATRLDLTADGMRATGFSDLDHALTHLQSADGDPHLAAWARLVRANRSYTFYLGWRSVLLDARRAEQAFARLGEARNVARARLLQAAALVEIALDTTAKDPTPEEAADEGVKIFQDLTMDPALSARERGRSVNYIGYFRFNANAVAAVPYFQRALAEFRAIGDRDGIVRELSNLAAIAAEVGDFPKATGMYDELLARVDELSLPERRAGQLVNAATVDALSGNTDRAIERFMALLQLARDRGMHENEARALNGLSLAYRKRGDMVQAAVFGHEGIKTYRKIEDPVGLILILANLGQIARDSGDLAQALELHREALARAPEGDLRARMLAELARDQLAGGDVDRGITTLRSALANEALRATPARWREVELRLAEALLLPKMRTPQNLEEALGRAADVIAGARRSSDLIMEWSGHEVRAQVLFARNQYDESRQEFERAIEIIFRYRATTSSPDLQATVLTRAQQTFRGYTDLLLRDVAARPPGELQPATAIEEDALRVLESARVINFDAVRVARVDSATQAHIDALLTQMADKRARMAATLSRASAPGTSLAEVQLDIARLRAQIDLARSRGTHGERPEGWSGELTQPWPTLPPDTAQVSYTLGESFVYLWVRDSTGIRVARLALSPAALERELSFLMDRGASSPAEIEARLSRLSGWVLPSRAIAPGVTRVDVVAEGRLAAVPFAALREASDGGRRMSEGHSITMITSMFETQQPTSQAHQASFIGIASGGNGAAASDETRSFPALASTNSESRSIFALFNRDSTVRSAKLLDDRRADAAAVKEAWGRGADVMHFATHGLADVRQPMASLLMLPAMDGAGSATYLTAGQVQEWHGDVGLVYLSACETAVGPARFADGMPGLQRAFLRAGAHGVIATLWPIEDGYASEFALDFYRLYTSGMPAAQALSETQRAWLAPVPGLAASEQQYRRMTAWAHAYYTR